MYDLFCSQRYNLIKLQLHDLKCSVHNNEKKYSNVRPLVNLCNGVATLDGKLCLHCMFIVTYCNYSVMSAESSPVVKKCKYMMVNSIVLTLFRMF